MGIAEAMSESEESRKRSRRGKRKEAVQWFSGSMRQARDGGDVRPVRQAGFNWKVRLTRLQFVGVGKAETENRDRDTEAQPSKQQSRPTIYDQMKPSCAGWEGPTARCQLAVRPLIGQN